MSDFEISTFRQLFPILNKTINDKPLTYLDNGATTQKPRSVIDCEQAYYQEFNANVHRASYQVAAQATSLFEQARNEVKAFINAKFVEQIIWTKGCTESINLVAQSWGMANLKTGDVIVLTHAEHHANIVPWQLVAEKTGAIIKILPLTESGIIDVNELAEVICAKTKIVCCAHVSNVIGKINPVEHVISQAKKVGALTLIDGAQAAANTVLDMQALDCDFYAFSAHKMYGPTGVGVLYGKKAVLEAMPPYQGGGEMITTVSFSNTQYQPLPFKFEAGTPNIAGVIAFAQAIKFIKQYQLNTKLTYKQQLHDYAYQALKKIKGLEFIVKGKPDLPIYSFNLANHVQDIASQLDIKNIAVRVGRHCAMPLFDYLHCHSCVRVSLAPYNTIEEIDVLVDALTQVMQAEGEQTFETQGHSSQQLMVEKFNQLKGWDVKHREIMLLGKSFPRMDKSLRNEQSLINGCESQAWLTFKLTNGIFHFQADSDAKIIRGLLAIVLAAYNDKNKQDIIDLDIESYLQQLGLLHHLSPSRGNGLIAITKKIKQIALNES